MPSLNAGACAQPPLWAADPQAASPWDPASANTNLEAPFTELLVELLPAFESFLSGRAVESDDAAQPNFEEQAQKNSALPVMLPAPIAVPMAEAALLPTGARGSATEQAPAAEAERSAAGREPAPPVSCEGPWCGSGTPAQGFLPAAIATESHGAEAAAPAAEAVQAAVEQWRAPAIRSEQARGLEQAPLVFAARLKARPGDEPSVGLTRTTHPQPNAIDSEAQHAARNVLPEKGPASPNAPPPAASPVPPHSGPSSAEATRAEGEAASAGAPAAAHSRKAEAVADSGRGEAGLDQRNAETTAWRSFSASPAGRERTLVKAASDSSAVAAHELAHQPMEQPRNEPSAHQPSGTTRAAPARTEEAVESQDGPRDIALRLVGRNASQSVAVRFVERGGQIQVSVRTADNGLSESLRQQLPGLATRLQGAGFEAEIWGPGQASSGVTSRLEPARQPEAESSSTFQQGSQNDGQSGSERQPRQQQSSSAWREALEFDESPALRTLRRIQHDFLG